MAVKRGFAASNAAGKKGERAVAALFLRHGLPCSPNPSPTRAGLAAWDLAFRWDGRDRLVEVKYDLYEARSGNVAVEYYNPAAGRPSGIAATKSDLWAVVLASGQVWAAPTPALKLYFDTRPCLRDVACGGDGNAAMRLYRRADLFPAVFARLDDLAAGPFHAAVRTILDYK